MTFSTPTNPGAVWTNASRTLTGNGTGITTNVGLDNSALANGSTAGFAAAAGTMLLRTIVGIGAANVTWAMGLISGGTFRSGVVASSGASLMFHGCCSTTIGMAISNTGTVSGNYTTSGLQWNS